MGRATIADIARRAEVSTATVDRVLNARAGVSPANRQRVLQAAKELGYLPTDGAVPMPSRPAHLEFFLPFHRHNFMRDIADHIGIIAAGLPLVASCRVHFLDGLGPDALVPALEGVGPQTDGVGIVTIDHPRTRLAIQKLCEAGVRVVTIASDVPSTARSAYVGVDNLMAGRTAALLMGRLSCDTPGKVALFLGSRAFQGHREREFGFRALLEEDFPRLEILPAIETGENSDRSRPAMAKLLRDVDDLVGVYCLGGGRTGIAEAIRAHDRTPRPFVILHELSGDSRSWLVQDLIDVVIDQDAHLIAEQAILRLLGAIAVRTPLLAPKNVEPRIVFRENIPVR